MNPIEYKEPLFAIAALAALLLWSINYWRLFKRPQFFVPTRNLGKRKLILRFIVWCIAIVAWILIGISVTAPKRIIGIHKNPIEANDIFFVVDVSASMLATDFNPNRMEVAKKRILDFVKLMPTDRIGIIVFAEKVFTLLPLTTDLELIKRVVPEIKTPFKGLGSGTNIGDAIALAVGRGAQSIAKHKTIILLTDGASNVGILTPLEAAENARENKIKIYSIGMGADADAKMPTGVDVFGRTVYQSIPGGSYDLETLNAISQKTGGKAYVAKSSKALDEILQTISKLEKSKIQASSRVLYEELFYKYLLAGVILLLCVEFFKRILIREVE